MATTSWGTAKADMASGLATDWKGSSRDCGANDASANSGAAAAILASQRQRGEGSQPVGVSSSMKPRQAARGMAPRPRYTAT
jgi:hypothetical protein